MAKSQKQQSNFLERQEPHEILAIFSPLIHMNIQNHSPEHNMTARADSPILPTFSRCNTQSTLSSISETTPALNTIARDQPQTFLHSPSIASVSSLNLNESENVLPRTTKSVKSLKLPLQGIMTAAIPKDSNNAQQEVIKLEDFPDFADFKCELPTITKDDFLYYPRQGKYDTKMRDDCEEIEGAKEDKMQRTRGTFWKRFVEMMKGRSGSKDS